jgi:hypothetical protein
VADFVDARSKTGKASDAHSVMRYPIRASELDHRRLQALPPPMRASILPDRTLRGVRNANCMQKG